MRSVFVYGDSISMQYGYPLEKMLSDRGVSYERLGGGNSCDLADVRYNGLTTKKMLTWLHEITEKQNSILVFNCGLHDIVHTKKNEPCQVSIEEYRKNMEEICEIACRIFGKVVFCNFTPVDDEMHNKSEEWLRYNADVMNYNAMAEQIMEENGIPVVDLYNVSVKADLSGNIYADHVHVKKEVSQKHATAIIEKLVFQGYL